MALYSARHVVLVDVNGNPLGTLASPIAVSPGANRYQTIPASAADEIFGGVEGAIGNFLSHLVIVPATLDAGPVSIKDGEGGAITLFEGGTGSLLTLHPFHTYLGLTSEAGAWSITTGADVSAIVAGIW